MDIVTITFNEKKKVYDELFKIVKRYPNNQELGNTLRTHIINMVSDLNAETDNPDQGKLNL
jgi:hypothetical protein